MIVLPQRPERTGRSTLQERLAFFMATDALKDIQRANHTFAGARPESVAEHSWHVMPLMVLLADAAPKGTDHSRVRDLPIIHGYVAVYAGDTAVWAALVGDDVDGRQQAAGECGCARCLRIDSSG